MADTGDLLAQIDVIEATCSAVEAQAPSLPVPQDSTAAHRRSGTERTVPGATDSRLRVPGVAYVATHAQAVRNGWTVRGARPEGRAGQFVHDRPDHTGAHSYIAPATLGAVFRTRSTMLDNDVEESWRTDTAGAPDPPTFPNLDIILANAQDTPEEFVQSFVDQGWATSTAAVGPLAPLVRQHIDKPAVQRQLDDNPASRKVLVLDMLLTYAQFTEGRKGPTLWLGCPVFPQQLLAVIQSQIDRQSGSGWQLPPLDQTVKLLGEVSQITDRVRGLAKAIVLDRTADWSLVKTLLTQGEELREAVQLLTSLSWEQACSAAHSSDLPTALRLLDQKERRAAQSREIDPDRARDGWRLPSGSPGSQNAPTFLLAREPADDEPKLTPEERDELETACKADETKSIHVSRARLLTESTGMAVIGLQPGGPDISRVKMPYYAETLLLKVQEELGTSDSLRKVPLVTLAKVFSLRITQNDNFVFEHLGLLISEDFTTEVALTKIRGTSQGAQIVKAKRHQWAAVSTMEDFLNIVEGLMICVRRLHHPSVCSHQEIYDLWEKLKSMFVNHGGHAHVAGLFQVFKTRMEEHALAVRTRTEGAVEALPPLPQLQSRSLALYNQVLEAARQQCLRDYVALRSGLGETAWGAYRGSVATIDADGKRGNHKSAAAKQAAEHGGQSARTAANVAGGQATAPAKRGPEQEPQRPRPRTPVKRPKRGGAAHHYCIRCGRLGHDWYDCRDQGWCTIPSRWPGFLKALAVKIRENHGIRPVFAPDENPARDPPPNPRA